MSIKAIHPAVNAGDAVNSIAAPGAGKRIVITGFLLMGDDAGVGFLGLASDADMSDEAEILGVAFTLVDGGGVHVQNVKLFAPANTGVWALVATGASEMYGYLEYYVESV